MSNSNDLNKGLHIIELEDRLETVQLAMDPPERYCRCGGPCKGEE